MTIDDLNAKERRALEWVAGEDEDGYGVTSKALESLESKGVITIDWESEERNCKLTELGEGLWEWL
jgi:DNA-binding PadR family transcriptional regulator